MIRCGSCGEENPPRARFCLGERLDAEAFRALQARYFVALRDAIERHGG